MSKSGVTGRHQDRIAELDDRAFRHSQPRALHKWWVCRLVSSVHEGRPMFGNVIAKIRVVREAQVVFAPLTRVLENRRLCASLALVLLAHVAMIWLLASQLTPPSRLEG